MPLDTNGKVTLKELEEIDRTRASSYVRELEMAVDGAIHKAGLAQGYAVQFFNDARLYHIDEAIAMLPAGDHINEVRETWAKIKERIGE